MRHRAQLSALLVASPTPAKHPTTNTPHLTIMPLDYVYVLALTIRNPQTEDVDEDEKDDYECEQPEQQLIKAYTNRLQANAGARAFLRRKAGEVGIQQRDLSIEEWQSEEDKCYRGSARSRRGGFDSVGIEVKVEKVAVEEEEEDEGDE
jgi:hypothetical protein